MKFNSEIRRARIGIEDQDGKGSISAYLTTVVNALNQVRQIAFCGRYWYVQGRPDTCFRPVEESWVPTEVKERMQKYLKRCKVCDNMGINCSGEEHTYDEGCLCKRPD